MTLIAPTVQAFFSDRLTRQLQASPRTIASYRDTLRLLLWFVQDTTGTAPSALDWDELDEPLIAAFLEHLELERHNSARTRNLRLTGIRSLFRYAARARLGAISRELAFNDPQADTGQDGTTDARGEAEDRNVELLVRSPYQ